ncbi:MAG: NOP5/NOP56 family protein [Nitrososphaerales archaeon]
MKGILYVCELGVMVLDERLDPIDVWKYPDDARIEIYDALKKGESMPQLRDFISNTMRRLDGLIIIEDELRKELGKEGIIVEEASNELVDELWDKKIDLIIRADFAKSEEDAKDKIRDFAIALTESRLREVSARRDLHIMEAIQALDEVDKASNLLATRVREWYGLHFPELSSLIDEPLTYTRLVKEFGERKNFGKEELARFGLPSKKAEAISLSTERSKGGKIRGGDLEMVSAISEEAFRLNSLRDRLSSYVEKNMEIVAPNITSVVGATIGARLMAKAGGLEKMAMLPASTIQVLGAEKALFRALRTGSRPPKHGIIFQHQAIHSAPKWQRGKIARSIAGKIAIASRIDAFRGSAEKEVEQKLQKRLEEIKAKYGEPPIEERDKKVRRKKRGGYARGS